MIQNNQNSKERHTFVICAYKESKYLEKCIRSLFRQTTESQILLATSTPNAYISALCEKYDIPCFVNEEPSQLAGDWNFALSCAQTPFVTLAHQDDIYEKHYTEKVLAAAASCKNPLIIFTDYAEVREDKLVKKNHLLKIKRLMLLPLKISAFWGSKFVRRRILSMGSPICCPSVTYAMENLEGFSFINNMKSNIDWQAWEEISRRKGEFAYISQILTGHRIHEESTTSEVLKQNARREEDLFMYCKFWPRFVANIIEHFYVKSEKSNF